MVCVHKLVHMLCYGMAIGHYKWRYNVTSSVDLFHIITMHATMQLLLFLVQNFYLYSVRTKFYDVMVFSHSCLDC